MSLGNIISGLADQVSTMFGSKPKAAPQVEAKKPDAPSAAITAPAKSTDNSHDPIAEQLASILPQQKAETTAPKATNKLPPFKEGVNELAANVIKALETLGVKDASKKFWSFLNTLPELIPSPKPEASSELHTEAKAGSKTSDDAISDIMSAVLGNPQLLQLAGGLLGGDNPKQESATPAKTNLAV